MADLFTEIKPEKISEAIVAQLKGLIGDARLQPGEKLPPERVLAARLGVGRSSLREAINTLETLGFVEIRKRQGVFVSSVGSLLVPDPLRRIFQEDQAKLPKLYEVRKDIERAAAFQAASCRTAQDLERMQGILSQMQRGAETSNLDIADDTRFHLAVAQATHNFFRIHILKSIFDLANDYLSGVLDRLLLDPANAPVIFRQHQDIFEAIRLQDPERSQQRMNTHLEWVEAQWGRFSGFRTQEPDRPPDPPALLP